MTKPRVEDCIKEIPWRPEWALGAAKDAHQAVHGPSPPVAGLSMERARTRGRS